MFERPFFRILSRLGPQDGPMLEAKMDPKSIKNRCPKTIKFWRPLGTSKNRKISGFGGQHGGKLAPKSRPRSMLSSKGGILKKLRFSLGKIHFFDIRGVQVGSKNRWKIDVKNDTETEGLGRSIFIDFWWILDPSWASKTEPRRSKIDVENASKFD